MPEMDDVKAIGARFAFPAPAKIIIEKVSRQLSALDAGEHDGMTLRQYAAIAAMQGLYAGYYGHVDGIRAVESAAAQQGISASQMIARAALEGGDDLLALLAKEPTR